MENIDDNSVDMILCDLPYGTTVSRWDTIIPFEPLWNHYGRVIRNDGAIVLTAAQPFTSALVMSKPSWYRHQWVWNKNNSAGFANVNKRPFQICEDVLVFGRQKVRYFPIMEERGKPRNKGGYSGSDNYRILPSRNRGKSNVYYPKNLLHFSNASQAGKIHPTQKPVALFEYLIKTYTKESELVLDNCAGSATTGVACQNTNRRFILIEQEQKYFDLAKERLENNLSGLMAG